MKQRGFLKLYHTIWNEIAHLKPPDKLFTIYLMSKQNLYGEGAFYLSDRVIMGELGISRRSLFRRKKCAKMARYIEYTPGKYRKSVAIWHLKGVPFGTERGAKMAQQEEGIKKKDIKRGVSQPIHIHNTIVNTTEKLDRNAMHKGFRSYLNTKPEE
jgi:hypothetical protein